MTFIADFVSKYWPRISCIYAVDLTRMTRIEKYGRLCSLQVIYILLKFPQTFSLFTGAIASKLKVFSWSIVVAWCSQN